LLARLSQALARARGIPLAALGFRLLIETPESRKLREKDAEPRKQRMFVVIPRGHHAPLICVHERPKRLDHLLELFRIDKLLIGVPLRWHGLKLALRQSFRQALPRA
jgi:hypothetical protein